MELSLRSLLIKLSGSFDLSSILEAKEKHYHEFKVRKKSGGYRQIMQPSDSLLAIQKEVAKSLYKVHVSHVNSHGFEKGKCIVTNASNHVKCSILLNIDLKDFFGSITKSMVTRSLSTFFGISKLEANSISELVTYKGILPQGSPSSPIISNIVCFELDEALTSLGTRFAFKYTRYADDLTFSFQSQRIGPQIVPLIISELNKHGFAINQKKFRVRHEFNSQTVTGIVVNEKLNVSRPYLKTIRAILHNWEKKGYHWARNKYNEKYKKPAGFDFEIALLGKINFIGHVRGFDDPCFIRFLEQFNRLLEGQKEASG